MFSAFKNLHEYLCKSGKTFVVPNYQRGYKWSVKEKETQPPHAEKLSHVEKLCDSLIEAHTEKRPEYFLQGITVSEQDKRIVLIDGQQRTTTLYLLLWFFGENRIKDINLDYDIRMESKNFIHRFHDPDLQLSPLEKTDNQDIHYLKAWLLLKVLSAEANNVALSFHNGIGVASYDDGTRNKLNPSLPFSLANSICGYAKKGGKGGVSRIDYYNSKDHWGKLECLDTPIGGCDFFLLKVKRPCGASGSVHGWLPC